MRELRSKRWRGEKRMKRQGCAMVVKITTAVEDEENLAGRIRSPSLIYWHG